MRKSKASIRKRANLKSSGNHKKQHAVIVALDRLGDAILYPFDILVYAIDFMLKTIKPLPGIIDKVSYPIEFFLDKFGDAIIFMIGTSVKPFTLKPQYRQYVLHLVTQASKVFLS